MLMVVAGLGTAVARGGPHASTFIRYSDPQTDLWNVTTGSSFLPLSPAERANIYIERTNNIIPFPLPVGQEIPLPLPGMEGALIMCAEMRWVVRLQFFLSQGGIMMAP